jgi:hypothetical protein
MSGQVFEALQQRQSRLELHPIIGGGGVMPPQLFNAAILKPQ